MSDRIFRKTTTHISPYLGGLAPETHQFVEYLNREIVDYVSKEGLWIKGVVTREYEPPFGLSPQRIGYGQSAI